MKAQVTEHQLLTVKCACGCETKAAAPEGAAAPVQYGPRLMGTGLYLWHGQFLSRDRACQALSELFGCAPAPGALASAARKAAGLLAPALAVIGARIRAAEVAHFDETGFRVAGKLAWVHSASAGDFAQLDAWITAVEADDQPELHSFARGLRHDHDAVLNGLTLPWNSGVNEGNVNRVKMIKRQMYGRAGFPLLRKRVLLAT